MYEKVFAYLDAHAEDYAAQLCRWVEVPSVKGEATPGAPFGKDVRRMLDMAMADAKVFGYETRDFDGYACDITLPGESEEAIAVLGHLDVVPAGDNWATRRSPRRAWATRFSRAARATTRGRRWRRCTP